MSVLQVLVPLAILIAGGFCAAWLWAVRRGQFDDIHTPALRMLNDDDARPTKPTGAAAHRDSATP